MRALSHPLVIASLVLWVLNDHLLKDALHNGVTGKLSDVASLVVFPLLPVAVYDLLSRDGRSHNKLLMISVATTGTIMAAIKLFEPAAEAYRVGLAALQYPFLSLLRMELWPLHRVRLTMDPTDLYTLPALLVPLWVGRTRSHRSAVRVQTKEMPTS